MVQYIIKIAETIAGHAERGELGEALALRASFAEELDRLDPRDFLPSAQYDFVMARSQARRWAQQTMAPIQLPSLAKHAWHTAGILSNYGGDGSRASVRSFSFIIDSDLRDIIDRDYRELALKVFPSGAWKSSVVLAGSLLEAILYDQLAKNSLIKQSALASSKAPKDSKTGKIKDFDAGDWRLFDLIAVATDISLLPADRSKSIDQILRDFRNFVHPKKELRAKYPCTEAEAMLALGALEAVCNVLTP
jgi:hypothetical protein